MMSKVYKSLIWEDKEQLSLKGSDFTISETMNTMIVIMKRGDFLSKNSFKV